MNEYTRERKKEIVGEGAGGGKDFFYFGEVFNDWSHSTLVIKLRGKAKNE